VSTKDVISCSVQNVFASIGSIFDAYLRFTPQQRRRDFFQNSNTNRMSVRSERAIEELKDAETKQVEGHGEITVNSINDVQQSRE
jgi:hypothetical protein